MRTLWIRFMLWLLDYDIQHCRARIKANQEQIQDYENRIDYWNKQLWELGK